MAPSHPSALRQLAELAGIVPEYVDQTGRERRRTSDETRVALLAAMGVDASTPARATEALAAWRPAPRPLVLRGPRATLHIPLPNQEGQIPLTRRPSPQNQEGQIPLTPARWRLEVVTEAGDVHESEGAWRQSAPRTLRARMPLPFGYHRARVFVTAGGRESRIEQSLIVAPRRCVGPADLLDGGRCFGVTANLYSLRSAQNWGVGDFSDLAMLATWAGAAGADFVGVNPLHALLDRGDDVSPYSPVSRLFRNPIYIDVGAVPEMCEAADVPRTVASPEFQSGLAALRESNSVCYEPVMARKQMALDALYRVFAERRSTQQSGDASDRVAEFEAFVRAGGESLERFATWMALAEHQRAASAGGSDWRAWPEPLRDPSSAAVREFAAAHRDRIDFHRWLQFEADRQLGLAADVARRARMQIGLYQDLAIGSSPAGADTWSHPELFVQGASVGAPPDPYAADGQNWGLPPLDPRALAGSGYEYFIKLVRAGLRHAGALRIDHVMGLFRLFWIPRGGRGRDGAYVRYPADDLLGIIALESARHGALVVGEDLGTVPPDVPPALARWGVLSSRVLYFERERRGGFKPARGYPRLALATANTHDMPSLAAYMSSRDIAIRRQVGLIEDDAAESRARDERERDKAALVRRLRSAGLLGRGADALARGAEFRGAVHAFLCRTPSQLVGLSLDDLCGEVEPVNVPGVGPDRFPSWTRKMSRTLDEIAIERDVKTAMRCTERAR